MLNQPLKTTLFLAELSLWMYLNHQANGIRHSQQTLSRVGPEDRYHHAGRSCRLDSRIKRSIARRKRNIVTVEMKLNALLA
jgi:hypothetical protein